MTEQTEIAQLATIFNRVTGKFLTDTEHKAEVARAMQDQDQLVKEQIKLEVLKAVRQIFAVNYTQITGDQPWP